MMEILGLQSNSMNTARYRTSGSAGTQTAALAFGGRLFHLITACNRRI
jgi:hypothetical protein